MRHLESFLAVAEEGSFTRAALRLHISQPPLSLRIKELEAMMEVRLFDRTTKHVRLTAAGQIFLEKIQVTMQSLHAAVEASRQAEQGVVGHLRVGYTLIASDLLLPRLISEFGSLHPKIVLDLVGPCASGYLGECLLKEEIDVALCFLPLADERIESRKLTLVELALVLPSRHPLARTKRLFLHDMAHEPFVSYPASGGFHLRAAIDAECARAGFRPRVVKESLSSQTLLCLVAAGVGVAILPKDQQARRIDGVTFRALYPPQLPFPYGLAWRRCDTSPFVANFLSVANKMFPDNKIRRILRKG